MLRFVAQQLFYVAVQRVLDRTGALETRTSLWVRMKLADTIRYREA